MKKLLDANAILRFLLNDNEEMAAKTECVIKNGAFTKEVVIAEVIYVLCGVYKIERSLVSSKISELLKFIEIENSDVLKKAMEIFSTFSLDFVDCLLIAYNNVLDIDVFSFDKKLNNKLKPVF